ncbi:MAG: tetratricopeptide repeat protein [Deltaproteobacteria bacterium]|nr:tetratricopeptide repeat protein [Deltaproteobacteria bacterium]
MISACLITKNEEAWIGECIAHLKPIVSEFIVVDTGSTDRTIEIARAAGARVSKVQWQNDFAKARNTSLEKATQRWILIIDPDERLAKKDLEKLKNLTLARDAMAYSFNARNYSRNPAVSHFKPSSKEYPLEEKDYPGYFESRKIRLFQNIPSIRFVGSVHELVETTVKGKIIESDIPFHHYGSTPEMDAEKNKRSFYQEQGTKKINENPNDWKAHFELGVEYLGAKEHGRAVKELERAKQLKPNDSLILSNLGYAYMEAGKLSEGQNTLDECLRLDPHYHDALLNLGVIQMRRQKWAQAVEIFDKIVKKYPGSFLAYRNSGNCFAHQRKFQAAAKCFEKAIQLFPQYADARIDLGLVCIAGGRPDVAKPILEEALKISPSSLRAKALLDEATSAIQKK